MPYRYVMKWKRGYEESLTVEAWPKSKELAMATEHRKPSFVIGKIGGSRTIMLRELAEEAAKRFGVSHKGLTTKVDFPLNDIPAIAAAFRLGLLAAVLSEIDSPEAMEHAYENLTRATPVEIWFWASKMLGVIDHEPRKHSVVSALVALTGAENE